MSVSVKISILEHGTRRLNVQRGTSFTAFQETVKELFGIENRLDWVYVDEENDLVTFSTNQEFADLLAAWNENNILRLNATAAPLPQRVVQPEPVHEAPRQVGGGCPFASRGSCNTGCCPTNRVGCPLSMPSRIAVAVGLFYSIFTHPLLTFIGLASFMLITRHHYPATYDRFSVHARNHWRKVALAYGLYMLFNCRICTILLAIPVGIFLVKKFKRCHEQRTGECCYVNVRDTIRHFMERNNITLDNIERAVQHITTPAPAPAVPAQATVVPQKSVEPSAPPMASMYPSAVEDSDLPQRVDTAPFSSQIEMLEGMGFTNKKLNEHLLRNFNGNLDRVVSSLIQLQNVQ